ncbi:MAG TPA: hypothetical protein VHD63_10800, partial [Ktedonobacteraceae bacterium]|nr:hypothetical protein [Ktedonobacteraceae bacterium]
ALTKKMALYQCEKPLRFPLFLQYRAASEKQKATSKIARLSAYVSSLTAERKANIRDDTWPWFINRASGARSWAQEQNAGNDAADKEEYSYEEPEYINPIRVRRCPHNCFQTVIHETNTST